MQRKNLLVFQASDSLQDVYAVVSGGNGRKLWPVWFGERVAKGALAHFSLKDEGCNAWHPTAAYLQLGSLAAKNSVLDVSLGLNGCGVAGCATGLEAGSKLVRPCTSSGGSTTGSDGLSPKPVPISSQVTFEQAWRSACVSGIAAHVASTQNLPMKVDVPMPKEALDMRDEPRSKLLEVEANCMHDRSGDFLQVPYALPSTLNEQLFAAITQSDVKATRDLVRIADVNMCTSGGMHILFYALMKVSEPEIIQLLISAGADVHHTDANGNRALHHWARAVRARKGLLDIGLALAQAGADVNAQRSSDGISPLHLVVIGHNNRRGWLDFHKAAFLVKRGAMTNLETQRGQLPSNLLKYDRRSATLSLVQLLTAGHAKTLPHCSGEACRWCSRQVPFV